MKHLYNYEFFVFLRIAYDFRARHEIFVSNNYSENSSPILFLLRLNPHTLIILG